MRALDRKVLRDFAALKGQLLAIATVIATGAGLFLAMRVCLHSLQRAQHEHYSSERFGDVFAALQRAPEHVAEQLRAIPGVQRVQTRVVAGVTLDLEGVSDTVTGQLVSLPDHGRALVNAIRLRRGRMPAPGRTDEVVASEAFATAHRLRLGTELGAVIDGRKQRLRVVGTALAPEFVYALGPGMVFPDDRLFGVLWMRREALGPALDMDGAFNSVALGIERGIDPTAVVRRVDAELARYGCRGALPRREQVSHFFLSSELQQLRTIGMVVPILFLIAAAFLLNVVVGQIIAGQREQIAALKALGYRDREIGVHFGKLVGAVVLVGLLGGLLVAASIGSWMIRLYSAYYWLPGLAFALDAREVLQVALLCGAAAALGTFTAIRRTVRLPPAEAMRAEAPAVYRRTLLERLGLEQLVPPAVAMVLRDVERRPLRRLLTLAGMVAATALVVASTFMIDAIDHAMVISFGMERREDVQVTLTRPRSTGVLAELRQLPGVLHAEPYRTVPVRFRNGVRHRNGAITGVPREATLQQVLDVRLATVPPPPDGLVLTRKLAEVLGVQAGDTLQVDVLEGQRPTRSIRVARLAETYFGLGAQMDLDALCRVLHEPRTLTGALLTVDDDLLPALHRAVKATPAVAGITSRNDALRTYRKLIDEHLGTSIAINIAFSLIMALGMLVDNGIVVAEDIYRHVEEGKTLREASIIGAREVAMPLLGSTATTLGAFVPLVFWTGIMGEFMGYLPLTLIATLTA
ncbi:MAG: efflux RND transporter permease subunit, partial [Planctomycetes bacterium]|nr:efflux RND transporter permease subunit [Planctomycetota bacterium]